MRLSALLFFIYILSVIILDFFIQNGFLNGPKKLVFVRMYESTISEF